MPINFLQAIWQPGEIREIRMPDYQENGYRKSLSGYFESPEKAARAIKDFDGKTLIYVTLNPVLPDLLSRAKNRLTRAKNTTSDNEIIALRYQLIDIDPVRPSGIPSTESEKEEALKVMTAVREGIKTEIQTLPYIEGMSGNGYYLIYKLEPAPITEKELYKNLLAALKYYDTEKAKIDEKVYNPSRLVKVLGTMAVKGDATAERPHRRSVMTKIRKPKISR